MIENIPIIDILNIKDISVFAVLIAFIIYLIYVNNKSLSKIEDSVVELRETYEAILAMQRDAQKHLLERLDKREDLIINMINKNDRH
ncbi:MAG: hypothetical protein K2P17_04005 [Helicobacteraceae bacterium]|nr:hypothetical protein [Helicobacteraceae bacterium]